MTNVKKIGNDFEKEFADKLFSKGFWVHNCTQGKAGQPADLIACKDNTGFLIDCKTLENGAFPFTRIEPNQITAMRLWQDRVNDECWFAIKIDEDVRMLDYALYTAYKMKGYKTLGVDELRKLPSWEEWVDGWQAASSYPMK